MLRVAARYADLLDAEGPMRRPEEAIPLREAADAACAEVGRDPATLSRTASMFVSFPMAEGTGQQAASSPGSPPTGAAPEEVAELFRGYAREGLSHVQLWLRPHTIDGLERCAAVLEPLDGGQLTSAPPR
jgi:hypothetical protein